MKPNFWIYSDTKEQNAVAASLILFNAEIFKGAKCIAEITQLEQIHFDLNSKRISIKDTRVSEFIFEYLMDTIRILVFFENYMKAELILKGYCVHWIDKGHVGFKDLGELQKSKPILLKQIHDIQPFAIDQVSEIINHNAVKETTIGMKELLSSGYLSSIPLPQLIVSFVKDLNRYRNKLHFNNSVEFLLHEEFISNLKVINAFVDDLIKRLAHN